MIYNRRHKHPPGAVSIMRGTPHGNPFVIGVHGNRDEVLAKFRVYAVARLKEEPTWLDPIRGRDLLCCCKPLACHGDIIEELM